MLEVQVKKVSSLYFLRERHAPVKNRARAYPVPAAKDSENYEQELMDTVPTYHFNLPPEEQVIRRNQTITTYYAQLYQRQPQLYKWAGMAAFASFHIGGKLRLWNWKQSGIKPLSFTCNKKNRTLEDDFQVIRIINNRIFSEIGWIHLAFVQMDYLSFKQLLIEQGRHRIIIDAFAKLNNAREQLSSGEYSPAVQELIWEANTDILWHEQSEVVQPMFDKLSDMFARAMTFFASFDYGISHRQTGWRTRSRFILFMLLNGRRFLKKNRLLPEVTDLQHRWYWIANDLLEKWKSVESNRQLVTTEINILARIEDRNLLL